MCEHIIHNSLYDDEFYGGETSRLPVPTHHVNILENTDVNNIIREATLICGRPVVNGSTKCVIHKCIVEGCNNSKSYSRHQYCDKHMCHYVLEQSNQRCHSIVVDGKKYCERHKCIECDEHIHEDTSRHCEQHIKEYTCQFEGCTNTRPVSEGETPYYYCPKHVCKICGRWGILGDDVEYCHMCKHKVEGYDGRYDEVHKCREAQYGGRYCYYEGCMHNRMYDAVMMGDLMYCSKYCYRHNFIDHLFKHMYGIGLDIFEQQFIRAEDLNDEDKKKILTKLREYADAIRDQRK